MHDWQSPLLLKESATPKIKKEINHFLIKKYGKSFRSNITENM